MDNTTSINLRLPTCNTNLPPDFVSLKLNVLVWSYMGLASNVSVNSVNDLICRHRPDLVILTKTMINGDKLITQAKNLNFDKFTSVDSGGLSGGILVL